MKTVEVSIIIKISFGNKPYEQFYEDVLLVEIKKLLKSNKPKMLKVKRFNGRIITNGLERQIDNLD